MFLRWYRNCSVAPRGGGRAASVERGAIQEDDSFRDPKSGDLEDVVGRLARGTPFVPPPFASSDYNFTDYNFKKNIEFQTWHWIADSLCFSPSSARLAFHPRTFGRAAISRRSLISISISVSIIIGISIAIINLICNIACIVINLLMNPELLSSSCAVFRQVPGADAERRCR